LFGRWKAVEDVEAPSEDGVQHDARGISGAVGPSAHLPDGRAELRQAAEQAGEGNWPWEFRASASAVSPLIVTEANARSTERAFDVFGGKEVVASLSSRLMNAVFELR